MQQCHHYWSMWHRRQQRVPVISATCSALGCLCVQLHHPLWCVKRQKGQTSLNRLNWNRAVFLKRGSTWRAWVHDELELVQDRIHSVGCCQMNCSEWVTLDGVLWCVTDTWHITKANKWHNHKYPQQGLTKQNCWFDDFLYNTLCLIQEPVKNACIISLETSQGVPSLSLLIWLLPKSS